MTTSLVAPHKLPQHIVADRPFDLETWKKEGAALLRNLHQTQSNFEIDRWAIGDWLVAGEDQFGDKAYGEAEQITGWERGSLYNIVWVTRQFPISLRSETGLKWSHFKELARIKDDKVRVDLVQKLNDGFPRSVIKIRAQVDSALKMLREHDRTPKPKRDKTVVHLRISVKREDRDLIKRLARAEGKTPEVFLRGIVLEHLHSKHPRVGHVTKPRRSKTSKQRA
jgi:hypothetical protein